MAGENLYSVLGLTPEATGPEIRAAYQQLTAQAAAGQIPPAQRQAADEAYATLGDPIRRLRYDAQASAPAPPRFQMPEIGLPNRRFRVRLPAIPTLRAIPRPPIHRIDPLLGAAIGLVVIVGIIVLLLPLFRGNQKSASPQSVADLVTQTPPPVAAGGRTSGTPVQGGTPAPLPGVGVGAAGVSQPGGLSPITGLPGGQAGAPFAPGAVPGGQAGAPFVPGAIPGGQAGLAPGAGQGTFAPPGAFVPPGVQQPGAPGAADAGEPPFITTGVVIDTLRAVIAANAVRAGASQAGVNAAAVRPPTGAPVVSGSAPVAAAPAGIPITTPAQLPPVIALTPPPVAAAVVAPERTAVPPPPEASQPGQFQPQPGAAGVVRNIEAATPAATAAPNRIGVPTAPVRANNVAPQAGPAQPGTTTQPAGPAAGSGPNRIATAPPPGR